MSEDGNPPTPESTPTPMSSLPPWRVDIQIVDTSSMPLSGAMLVVGFPTHGLVGSIATGYLVEALKMTPVAFVDSEGLPPTVTMLEGIVDSPIRIYGTGLICGPDKKCSQLLVAISDIQPELPLLNPLGRALVDWAESKGVAVIFVIEGKPVETPREGEVRVVAMATQAGAPILKSSGFPPATGLLTGFGAALLRAGIHRKIPVVCLVPEARKDHPDGLAAATVIEAVRPLIPQIPVDPEPLRKQAQALEAAQRSTIQSHQKSVKKLTGSPAGEMYR